jgi:outer membrane protein
MRILASALVMAAVIGLAAPASAHEAGDWLFRAGGSLVDPKSDNGSFDGELDVKVDDQWGVTFNFTYMYTANIGIELLAALPYEHDIAVPGLGTVASVKQIPPTLSLQYHFAPRSTFQPYAGVGVNYTLFSSEKLKGPLAGQGLDFDVDSSSVGLAAQLGFDYKLSDQWFLNLDLRWIQIDTKATLSDGVDSSTAKVEIDPMVYGIHVGYRF